MRLYPTYFNKKRVYIANNEAGNLKHLDSMKGLKMAKEKSKIPDVKTFTDVFGGEFYPELPQKDLKDVIGVQYEVADATIIKSFKTQFGEHDLCLLLLTDLKTGDQFTTATSGEVIVKKIEQILFKGVQDSFPLLGTIVKPEGKPYYDII